MLLRVRQIDQNSSGIWVRRIVLILGNYGAETVPCLIGTVGEINNFITELGQLARDGNKASSA